MLKNKKIIVTLFIISYVIFATGFFALCIHYDVYGKIFNKNSGTQSMTAKERAFNSQTSLFGVYPTKETNIVMLGDSITFDAEWRELLGRNDIVNRGIGIDTTYGMLKRMEYVYKLNPKITFILAGFNDLDQGETVEEIFENYKKMLSGLKSHNIIPVIQSALYTSNKYKGYKEVNLKVAQLNAMLLQYSRENSIQYLDLNKFLSKDGELNNDYTYDGVHLLGIGYTFWVKEISKVLSTINI